MTHALVLLDALVCAAICLRVIFYRKRDSQHRPVAAFVAWIIVCASGAVPLLAALGKLPTPSLSDIVLHVVLCMAVCAARGNVTELFHTSEAENAIYRMIRRRHHA